MDGEGETAAFPAVPRSRPHPCGLRSAPRRLPMAPPSAPGRGAGRRRPTENGGGCAAALDARLAPPPPSDPVSGVVGVFGPRRPFGPLGTGLRGPLQPERDLRLAGGRRLPWRRTATLETHPRGKRFLPLFRFLLPRLRRTPSRSLMLLVVMGVWSESCESAW